MTVRSRSSGFGASSLSHAVTLPAGSTGDRLLVGIANDQTDTSTVSTYPGWTLVGTMAQGSNVGLTVLTRVATGSDSLTVGLSTAQEAAWVVVRLVGNVATPLSAFANGGNATAGAVTAITGLDSGQYDSIIFLALDNNGLPGHSASAPASWGTLTTPGDNATVVCAYSMDRNATTTGFTPAPVTWTTLDQWVTAHIVIAPPGPVLTPPDSVFDLSNWHLTTPADSGDGTTAQQIDQPALATYSSGFFYLEDVTNLMTCVAPVDGASTSALSGSTRAELRQHEKSGYAETAFDPNTTGRRQVTLTTRADATSITGGTEPRQEAIIFQIHGDASTPPLYLAAEWTSAGVPVTPRIRLFVAGSGLSSPQELITGITVSTDISIRCRVESATLKLWVAVGSVSALPSIGSLPTFTAPTSAFTDQANWYFKAGIYNKTTIDSGSSGQSIAKISHLQVLDPSDSDPALTASAFRPRRRHLPLLVR